MRTLNKHSASAANFAFNGCGKVFRQFIRAPRVNGAAGCARQKQKIKENKESSGMITRHFLQVKSGLRGKARGKRLIAFHRQASSGCGEQRDSSVFENEPSENTLNESPIQLLLRKEWSSWRRRHKNLHRRRQISI